MESKAGASSCLRPTRSRSAFASESGCFGLSRSRLTFSDGSSFDRVRQGPRRLIARTAGTPTTLNCPTSCWTIRPSTVSCQIRATTQLNQAILGGRDNTSKYALNRENVEFSRLRCRPEAASQAENAGSIPVTRSEDFAVKIQQFELVSEAQHTPAPSRGNLPLSRSRLQTSG
jgi:hypothetical protein